MKKLFYTLAIITILLSGANNILANNPPAGAAPNSDSNKKDATVYTLLAPIGNLTVIKESDNIGTYFNIVFRIAIGLAGVLAVIMIIVNGIKYMGGDSVFSKEEGRSGITSALLGLFIALGAYALLNTINPALLGKSGLSIDTVTITLETPIDSDADKPIPPAGTAQCRGGFERISTFIICKDINNNENLQRMLGDAQRAGFTLSGGALRTRDEQIELRKKNCKGDTTNPQATCNPLTALPGRSNHESGKALDIKCNNRLINRKNNPNTTPCFDWLVKNAKNYGFYNLQGPVREDWHWSVDGK